MNTDKIYAEAIANEYSVKDASKVVALRKLDKKAKTPANIFAFSFGVIAALVLGVGMCLSMKVIGDGSTTMIVVGIVAGIIGIVCACVNYPIFKRILKNAKEKYAGDIMRLANEISSEK